MILNLHRGSFNSVSSALRSSTPQKHLQKRNFMQTSIPETIRVTTHNQYQSPDSLSAASVLPSPLDQFKVWFRHAQSTVAEPEAMSISTATKSGLPSSRMVLLKGVDSSGFLFFTNYTSRKSREIEENPFAALTFYWREIHQQVRVVGRVEKLAAEESERYYNSRPLGSRLGAWASPQSTEVEDGEVQALYAEVEKKFGVTEDTREMTIPKPEFWGGWRVVPIEVEFWLGKPSRLHDRLSYIRKHDTDEWDIRRLAP